MARNRTGRTTYSKRVQRRFTDLKFEPDKWRDDGNRVSSLRRAATATSPSPRTREGGREASSAPHAMTHLPESLSVRRAGVPRNRPRSGPTAYVGPSRARPPVSVPAGSDPAGRIGWQLSVKRTRYKPQRRESRLSLLDVGPRLQGFGCCVFRRPWQLDSESECHVWSSS